MKNVPTSLLIIAIALSLIALPNQAIHAQKKSTVNVGGLTIAKKNEKDQYGGSMVPGSNTGTTLYLQAQLPDQFVIRVDEEAASVTIKDSKGNEMEMSESSFGFMTQISDDGKTVMMPIHSQDLPAKGSESIAIKGDVTLVCGADSITREVEVELEEGTKFKMAGIEFNVAQTGDSYRFDSGQSVELQSSKPPFSIQSLEAVLANGKTVEMSRSGSSEFGFSGKKTYGRNFDIDGKLADVKKLKVTYFQKLENVKVPLDLSIGFGF